MAISVPAIKIGPTRLAFDSDVVAAIFWCQTNFGEGIANTFRISPQLSIARGILKHIHIPATHESVGMLVVNFDVNLGKMAAGEPGPDGIGVLVMLIHKRGSIQPTITDDYSELVPNLIGNKVDCLGSCIGS